MALFLSALCFISGLALVSVTVGAAAYYTQTNTQRYASASDYLELMSTDSTYDCSAVAICLRATYHSLMFSLSPYRKGVHANDVESQPPRFYDCRVISGPYPACPTCHQFPEPHAHFVELCVNAAVWVLMALAVFAGAGGMIAGIFILLGLPAA
ncbi:hypothetical protein BOTBODRAFT_47223 [Botryobasidium botryosum FD-172 SS1]|uniref:Uncharacterized protein n=1 Tax=Botryobasidium botryosum (strain FD-172 SS1) TaxID=930990 RepID=A0A067MEP9_BOTB1|nr:hypothetical protein BOTBODRAFT_47223 [Botryobasidium botryosum FD-172 SS1]